MPAGAPFADVDVVLLDLRMPRMGGVKTIRAVAASAPDVRVLLLTNFDSDRDVLPAIEAGYLLRDALVAELKTAVRAAYAGQPVLARSVAGRLLSQLRRGPEPTLSPRELQVLRLVANYTTNRGSDRAAAVSEAYRRGLLSCVKADMTSRRARPRVRPGPSEAAVRRLGGSSVRR